jgi:hypothetical protein
VSGGVRRCEKELTREVIMLFVCGCYESELCLCVIRGVFRQAKANFFIDIVGEGKGNSIFYIDLGESKKEGKTIVTPQKD